MTASMTIKPFAEVQLEEIAGEADVDALVHPGRLQAGGRLMTATDNATVICTAWKPVERNTLRGFADLWLRISRLNIKGCAVHEKNGRRWVQLPAKPQLDQNRELVKDDAGKVQYWPVMEFDSREVADRFSEAALKAVEDFTFKQDFTPGGDHE